MKYTATDIANDARELTNTVERHIKCDRDGIDFAKHPKMRCSHIFLKPLLTETKIVLQHSVPTIEYALNDSLLTSFNELATYLCKSNTDAKVIPDIRSLMNTYLLKFPLKPEKLSKQLTDTIFIRH